MPKAAQPIASMTGYARQEGGDESLSWTWEVKSVNGRNLDIRCRVPAGYEALDARARAAAQARFARGNLQISLTVNRGAQTRQVQLNRSLLDQIVAIATTVKETLETAPPRLDGLLGLPGVLE
ncbi:MAG: hypothetical protein D6826_06765, partial [Alphaproteobacteria bacterium]